MSKPPLVPERLRPLRSMHILVVEDDRFAREQLSVLLSRFAARLTTAADGAEGLEIFKYERPDIVVTDINMPHLNGLDMAQAIKAMDSATPVILVTAHSDTQFFLRSIEISIDGYVVKPINADSLLTLLAKQAKGLLDARAADARAGMFRFILDINPNFILTLHAGEVDYINRTFLDFLGAPNLPGLKNGQHAGRMLEIDGRSNSAADLTWTALLDKRENLTHQAVFTAKPGETDRDRTYLVSAAGFPELDRTIVTFTDITPLAEERRLLRIRATTDALTGNCQPGRTGRGHDPRMQPHPAPCREPWRHHVRHRPLQGRQRHLRPSGRRRRADHPDPPRHPACARPGHVWPLRRRGVPAHRPPNQRRRGRRAGRTAARRHRKTPVPGHGQPELQFRRHGPYPRRHPGKPGRRGPMRLFTPPNRPGETAWWCADSGAMPQKESRLRKTAGGLEQSSGRGGVRAGAVS